LKIKLQGDAAALVGALSDDKCPIKVEFNYVLSSENCGGYAPGTGRMVVAYSTKHKYLASTICHEIGHAMGQTVFESNAKGRKKVAPAGMPYPQKVPTGTYYDDAHGHQGSHCAFGADTSVADFEDETGTCIMFGSGEEKEEPDQNKFCDTCLKYIK